MKDGPVEVYLAELARHLGRGDRARHRASAEIRDHLHDLVAEGRARGLDELAAETEAVDRFGAARPLARALRPARRLRRSVQVASAVTAASTCVLLALTVFSTPSPRIGSKAPDHAAQAANGLPTWCIRTIEAINAQDGHQILVQIDPRTGRVLGWGQQVNGYAPGAVCRRTTLSRYIGGLRFAAADPAAPFG
ncbi:MAG: hypothetical protein QOD65_4125 [Gaiellales bacterium]|nr:hypothetical protein [Gaiellales bacterium]